jgi:rare lipoprotein A
VRHAQRARTACAAAALLACALALAGCSVTAHRPAAPPPPAAPGPAPAAGVPAPPADIGAIADAVPRPEPRSAHGNPAFYDVFGQRYFVLPSAAGYLERGVASWYGPTFHGGNTSSGELYDMYGMTAAHKTLPLPSYARVTNLKNGKSVIVRINDRGPFVANRLIDLSYTAAAKLDMIQGGTTLVEVRALTPGVPDELTRSVESPAAALYVQAAAFADRDNAQRTLARLQAAGLSNASIVSPVEGRSHLYRVRLGPVRSVAEFDAVAARLATLGFADARLASD